MKRKIIFLLALGHGLNDLVAGYFLGSLIHLQFDAIQTGLGLFVYNLLAFGGQYPVALWLEKFGSPKQFLVGSYILNVAAIGLFSFTPHLSIVLAGVASAIYHVAGGATCARENRAADIGWFAAPGVAGLIAGGYFAWAGLEIMPWILVASAVFLFMLLKLKIPASPVPGPTERENTNRFSIDRHDLVMILLLTVISLRSVIWNIFQLIHADNYKWLLAIAVSASVGKIVGGWLADKIGWRLYIFISLFASMPLITFFKNELILFCIGIGLLQSGIPATTSLLIRSMKGKTERAIGLAFGTAIMAGAIIFYTPARNVLLSNTLLSGLTMLMLAFLFFSGRMGRTLASSSNRL